MNNIAVHMRICAANVSDSDVNSRRAAATSLAVSWGEDRNTLSIVSKAADVAEALGGNGEPSQILGDEIQAAIQKKSASFLYEERPLDVGVCAGMAMVSILGGNPGTNEWVFVDVYAVALWLSLAYQPALEAERRENLRREVFDAASNWSKVSAHKARSRGEVPDPGELKITIGENNKVTNDFKKVMSKTVDELRRNAVLDREELDFLWWAQLGRSRLLNKQLSDISEPTRIVAAGIEGAKVLRRLPCEVHREIVLRTLNENPKLDLTELLVAIGDDRTVLSTEFVGTYVDTHPTVFPLLHALLTGEVNGAGASVKRSISEWGERALLEAVFSKLIAHGTGKV